MALSAPLLLTYSVVADQKSGKWEAALRASSLGIQGEIGYLFNETFAMRLQAGGYDYHIKELDCKTKEKELNDAGYKKLKHHDIHVRPKAATIYADWYFLTKWWRVSTGVSYNRTKMHNHTDFRNFPEPEFSILEVLTCHYRYKRKISPYLGTGIEYRNIFSSKLILSMDAGITFFGKAKAKLFTTGPLAHAPIMDENCIKAEKALNEKWWVKYYPTLSIGLKYAF